MRSFNRTSSMILDAFVGPQPEGLDLLLARHDPTEHAGVGRKQ